MEGARTAAPSVVRKEIRPHLEGIATRGKKLMSTDEFEEGNQTSFRRDCDSPSSRPPERDFHEGNQTSFRRDCDLLPRLAFPDV